MQARTLNQQTNRIEAIIDRIARRSEDVAAMLSCRLNDLDAAAAAGLGTDEDLAALHTEAVAYHDLYYGYGSQAA